MQIFISSEISRSIDQLNSVLVNLNLDLTTYNLNKSKKINKKVARASNCLALSAISRNPRLVWTFRKCLTFWTTIHINSSRWLTVTAVIGICDESELEICQRFEDILWWKSCFERVGAQEVEGKVSIWVRMPRSIFLLTYFSLIGAP